MGTTTNYIPIDLYLKSDYEPDAEYVDGDIEERPVGERDHVLWQKALIRWFMAQEEALRIEVLFELRVQVGPTRFRVPDVLVVDSGLPSEQIITRAPLAVFEILSPEDTIQKSLRKLGDYEAMGIPQIWLVDPGARKYYRFAEGNVVAATVFGSAGDRIHFDMSEIEKLLPKSSA